MASVLKKFYEDRVVLVTGGSGFLGKTLLLKLLLSCPDIKGIIVLLRKKHGQNCRERLFNILSSTVSGICICFFHRSFSIFLTLQEQVWRHK
jgi:fatty acyl-CoA reductase